ncbi:BppU family phage baseplate upper protein [Staphylococcus kloosii]|uniref:BppU family phage baseplate upper protein n=1 Tax=Staphylococcus kloosii TaxID=29384 RepID=UPI00189F7957|nr:BppU family phage baseplate upper protein [Staphylococcus kloosii]MBF7025964.1 BppU family phage baseplate upper protein [Staphylococcus kloosii]
MTNGIDKKALFKLKSEPYLKPISDLGVGFYNLDENTAILRFQLSNAKGPLLIHENNLTAYAYFESSNGSASDVIELEIEDELNGIVTITLDKEFLQASTSTKVKGQVYIGVNNVDGKPEYNEVAVFREFTFEVADALINKISSFTKIEYIRMFSQLKERIEQQVRDIEEAIANGADYVAEMKSVLQQGIETLNAIVADGKSDIQAYIAQAKTDLTKVKDDATEDITTIANNAKSSVQDTASTAVNSINTKATEATEHVDEKVTEFNEVVEANGFVTPEKLTEDLTALEWQKYKLTNDDGSRISLGTLTQNIENYPPGLYECTVPSGDNTQNFNMPVVNPSKSSYIAEVDITYGGNGRKQIKVIENFDNDIYQRTIHTNGADKGWKEITNTQTDTGWVPFQLINGASTNVQFKNETDNGFDCAYRITTNGSVTRKSIRLNGSNLVNNQLIAQLPKNFFKNVQTFAVRSPIKSNYAGAYITAKPSGEVYFYVNGDSSAWAETFYIYGEYTWLD